VTELALVMNWKIFAHYEKDDEKAELYTKLWQQTDDWCMNHLKKTELQYYIKWTD
jgi:hypothetical protein